MRDLSTLPKLSTITIDADRTGKKVYKAAKTVGGYEERFYDYTDKVWVDRPKDWNTPVVLINEKALKSRQIYGSFGDYNTLKNSVTFALAYEIETYPDEAKAAFKWLTPDEFENFIRGNSGGSNNSSQEELDKANKEITYLKSLLDAVADAVKKYLNG